MCRTVSGVSRYMWFENCPKSQCNVAKKRGGSFFYDWFYVIRSSLPSVFLYRTTCCFLSEVAKSMSKLRETSY